MPVESAFENVKSVPSSWGILLSWGEQSFGGSKSSGANKMTAVINIHAKFRKTFVNNDASPWLRLNRKYLHGRGFLQNR